MRAVICKEHEGPDSLVVEELDDPTAGSGQIVIDVKSAGLNFPDLLMTHGRYQLKPPPPFSPGGEVAGEVAEVGEGVEGIERGDRVMAITGFGGFAERIVIGADRVVPVPESMDLQTAGGFAFTYATSYHALHDRARLKPGETLLVLGAAGGVGLSAVEIGAVMGAKVIAAASSDDKLALCEEHGATERINYADEDLKNRAKSLGGGGVDIVYDPVGGHWSELALRACKPFGRHLVIGFASGTIPSIPLNLPLLKECEIVGVAWGAWALREPEAHARNMEQLFAWHAEGKLHPHVSEVYPFDRAAEALKAMDERKVRGKVVLVP